MECVQNLFPGCYDHLGFCTPTYNEIVEHIGNVVLSSRDHDYQGTSYYLLEKDSKYGYLEFGWGSCSGCDALEACENCNDLQSICDRLEESVKWFDSESEFLEWAKNIRDWEGSFSWGDGVGNFIQKVNNRYGVAINYPLDKI